jgi:hypothetical protein
LKLTKEIYVVAAFSLIKTSLYSNLDIFLLSFEGVYFVTSQMQGKIVLGKGYMEIQKVLLIIYA